MESLWQQDAALPEFPQLAGCVDADVLVIGGGMAGLLTAYRLRERGIDAAITPGTRRTSMWRRGSTNGA